MAQEGSRLADAAELYESILHHFTGSAGDSSPGAAITGGEAAGDVAPQLPTEGASGGAGGGSTAKQDGSILDVPPSAVANLCVCYVIMSQNEMAEELLRRIEDATSAMQQAQAAAAAAATASGAGVAPPAPLPPHLSLANLAIGTLYCSKGNYGERAA